METGNDRAIDTFDPTKNTNSKKIAQLPSSYSEVPPMALPSREICAPEITVQLISHPQVSSSSETNHEQDWLENTRELLTKKELNKDDYVSWAAYRASQSSLSCHEPAIISLLPMFLENAHSLAMILHSMKVIKSAVQHVNPSQIPVIAVDQPLFALAKQIQWTLVDIYGEDQFVIMLGGLHIEMTAFKALGKWLSGSGWTEVLCNAGVATQGVADSCLTARHLTRTRRAHQVTAASLYMLMMKALDHAHEQVNAIVKGEGGAVGLTENPAALRRWMVAGPELARMVQEFEGNITVAETHDHHEQKPCFQSAFAKDVRNMVSSFEEVGNPFMEEGKDLIAIHTKDVMDAAVVSTVQNVRKIGEEQFQTFIKERFIDRSKPITYPLKKNNLPTFSTQSKKVISKDKAKVQVLKEDCQLFSRLYIACQSRDGNLEEFFRFENQPWPLSLSQMGQLRGGQKADLVKCLSNTSAQIVEHPTVDAVILDGAVIVQMLPPRTACTFEEYFNTVFASYILRQLEAAKRVDLVWDVYREDSLKRSAREKRGSGQRRKVLLSTRIPSDWKSFLRVDDNKDELFKLLANKVVSLTIPDGKEIYSTYVANSLTADELWITYSTGKNLHNIPAHSIAASLGQEKSSALPMFHAITGCDTVSFFGGRGKKTAWDVWKVFPELTSVLNALTASPEDVSEEYMAIIERKIVD
ncbi:hypothetical protein QZH41_007395 [Actinostola sp. cb2023]|nr:hypothetical protein QZH41_007395 [Actinostola sp. cb2023]